MKAGRAEGSYSRPELSFQLFRLQAAAHVLLYLFWGQCVDVKPERRQRSWEGVCQKEQVQLQVEQARAMTAYYPKRLPV